MNKSPQVEVKPVVGEMVQNILERKKNEVLPPVRNQVQEGCHLSMEVERCRQKLLLQNPYKSHSNLL